MKKKMFDGIPSFTSMTRGWSSVFENMRMCQFCVAQTKPRKYNFFKPCILLAAGPVTKDGLYCMKVMMRDDVPFILQERAEVFVKNVQNVG